MQREIIPVGMFGVNCVILWADPAAAWVVDPGADAPLICQALQQHNLQVALYFCTHGHIDHISALDPMLGAHPAPVWMHTEDAKWAFSSRNRLPPAYPDAPAKPASLQTGMHDGGTLSVGGLDAQTLFTPGHAPGAVCLHFPKERLLVSGDTLFAGSVGRTDLPGGDWRRLNRSLARLVALPDNTDVIPGHGPETTIGREKMDNPHLAACRI